jgi:hypothetical protein
MEIRVKELIIKQGESLGSASQRYKKFMNHTFMYLWENEILKYETTFITNKKLDEVIDNHFKLTGERLEVKDIIEEIGYVLEGVNFRLEETTNYPRLVQTVLPVAKNIWHDNIEKMIHFDWLSASWKVFIEPKEKEESNGIKQT